MSVKTNTFYKGILLGIASGVVFSLCLYFIFLRRKTFTYNPRFFKGPSWVARHVMTDDPKEIKHIIEDFEEFIKCHNICTKYPLLYIHKSTNHIEITQEATITSTIKPAAIPDTIER